MFLNKLKQHKQTQETNIGKNLVASLIETVETTERESRFNICKSCEHYYKITSTCTQCGCFMVAKTWLKKQTCPLKKW